MRFFDFSATALVAAAVVSATTPDSYGSLTSATTTYTITRTVSRVVETLTATRENTTSTYESTSSLTTSITIPFTPTAYSHASAPSVTIPSYGNGTAPLGTGTGTGALPSSSATFTPPAASEGGAGKLSIEGLGLAAIAGIVGLLAF